jgi:hypothetical protein
MSATSFSILAISIVVAFVCVAAPIYFLTRDKKGRTAGREDE